MKKAILLSTLTTILTLSLAGCGSTGGLEDSVGVQNSTAPTGPIAPVIAESLVPTECPENGPADDLAISMGNEAICDLGPVQFSLSLPETWDYEIRNLTFAGTTTTDAIIFWNIAYPEDTFTLIYAPVPGICGTGVTSEEITLPDSNLNGWKNTEIYQTEQKYWIYITLSNPDVPLQGNTLQLEATIPLTDWYTLETDFNRILETIQLQYTSFEAPVTQDILILPEETQSTSPDILPLPEETQFAPQDKLPLLEERQSNCIELDTDFGASVTQDILILPEQTQPATQEKLPLLEQRQSNCIELDADFRAPAS